MHVPVGSQGSSAVEGGTGDSPGCEGDGSGVGVSPGGWEGGVSDGPTGPLPPPQAARLAPPASTASNKANISSLLSLPLRLRLLS
ncbi:MAG TPA: hypothetical protein PKM21_19305, partial [Anaerolineales bacterium]|nr:hypothetical protein [Anaerolineales bacterium]